METSESGRGRRRLSSLVTTERVEEEWRALSGSLKHLEDCLPPTDTEAERARRAAIINEVAKHVLVGALVMLRECLPSHHRALMAAAGRFGIEKLLRGESRFRVRRLSAVDKFTAVFLAGLHEQLSSRLRAVWSREPNIDADPRSPRFVSRTGRYGARQFRGSRRKHAIEQIRVAEVQAVVEGWQAEIEDPTWVLHEVVAGALLLLRLIAPLEASMVRRLVRTSKGPVDLSYAVLAYLNGVAKRTVKAQIVTVRKDFATNAKIDVALRARGYTAPLAATESR